jgi:16S rRNA (cytosine967-C5)-methyltransferase
VPPSTRLLALRVLTDVEGGATVASRLAAPDAESLDPRERGFLHELVLGTLRNRGFLDHCLKARVERPLARLDQRILDVLRLGAYQILQLRVPDRAAVSESVTLARKVSPRGAGFVNAVLRALARDGAPPLPDRTADALGWITTAGSLPQWLGERWIARLGPAQACARAEAASRAALTFCRLNPRVPEAAPRAEAAGVVLKGLPVPGAFEIVSGQVSALAREGTLYVQDAGAQMVAHLAQTSGRLLDACAAPGGKATLLSDFGAALVIALEISPPRLRSLKTLVERWGAGSVRVVGGDARQPPLRGPFESVLVDAPCSGLGTLSRHPDIRWKVGPHDIPRHAERQSALLESTARLVAPGGHLVYATCSLESEENEGVVEPFLERHPEFILGALPPWAAPFASGPYARTLPEVHGGDGFFAARLVRAVVGYPGAGRGEAA